MPPVIIAVVAVAAEYGATAGLIAAGLSATLAEIAGAVVAMAVSFVGNMLFDPQKPSRASTNNSAGPRTVTIRQAVSPRIIVLGQQRMGGIVTFIALAGSSNQNLHVVITLSGHPLLSIGEMYIDGVPVGLDSSGNAQIAQYTGLLTVEKKLGHAGELAFPSLVAANVGWTLAHRQDGCASVHVNLTYDPTAFGNFDVSQISFDVMGHNGIYDPRSETTGFSDNAALVVAWYLTDPVFGLGSSMATDIDLDDLTAAANAADEYVSISPAQTSPFIADPTTDLVMLTEPMQPSGGGIPSGLWSPLLGDQVTLAVAGGTLPAGLSASTNYYWIPKNYFPGTVEAPATNEFSGAPSTYLGPTILAALNTAYNNAVTNQTALPDVFIGQLASSLANAIAGTAIDITDAGTGTFTLTRAAERRYCANGSFSADQTPSDVLTGLLSALGGTAGKAVWTGGQWTVMAGVYNAPAGPGLSETDLRKDGFTVQALLSHRDFCNGVKGKFINPAAVWQEDDYPPAQDPSLVTADGEEAWTSLNLPMELSPTRAQRIAWMELRRARLETQIQQLPCKLTALAARASDTIALSYARYGWSGMLFDVVAMNIVRDADANNMPVLGVDLALRLTDPSAFAWDPTQAVQKVIPPKSTLPDPSKIPAPGVPVIVASFYATVDGQSLKQQAVITWSVGASSFVASSHLEWRASGTTDWTVLPPVLPSDGTASFTLYDVAPGNYDFRAQSQSTVGAFSAFTELDNVAVDLPTVPPAAPSKFTITTLSGFAVLHFDPASDISVRIGGYGRVRWTPVSITDAAWQNGIDLGPQVPPLSTQETLELGAGTYMFKWVNFDGTESAASAMIEVDAAASLIVLANSTTVTESPTFAGAKTDCAVSAGVLSLAGAGVIDSAPDWDSIPDLDFYGGIVEAGSYLFASGIDLGSVRPVRIAASVTLNVVNQLDTIDERGNDVDDWADWDGSSNAAEGTGMVWERHTDDDPGGSPTWTDFAPVLTGDYDCRAFQFQLTLASFDPAYNTDVTALSVSASYN